MVWNLIFFIMGTFRKSSAKITFSAEVFFFFFFLLFKPSSLFFWIGVESVCCVPSPMGNIQFTNNPSKFILLQKCLFRDTMFILFICFFRYEDDDDKGDVLIYTGHGGRDPHLHRQCVDQKLEGGNLALERSMAYGIEIRVIRGIRTRNNIAGKVYFYDGLYKVVDCWLDKGKSGFGVYKYKMLRIEGQEEMGTVNYRMAENLKVNPLSIRPVGYLSVDLSKGREAVPILLFNDIDDDQDPLLFEYLARPIFPASAVQGKFASGGGGCGCMGNCTIGCPCAERNGGEFAYDAGGTLLRGKPLVYECGPYCICPMTCPNRVSQKGLKTRLEVFRSRETGWGVRSLDLIRAGTFVCEFSGIVLTKQQSEIVTANSGECLVYPNQLPARWLDWGDISDVMPDFAAADFPPHPDINFSIDVSRARNVACYLSHSCCPNVFVQFVLFDHYNPAYPHLMVFAMENIPPMRELSIDYGMIEEFVGKLTNE
jgi:[histone H3]-lysine9 N-trimethyltransferase EHMT